MQDEQHPIDEGKILSCGQKRNQTPGKDLVKCRLQQHKNGIATTNYKTRRYNTPSESIMAETFTIYHQQNLTGQRNQPNRNNVHKIQKPV